MDNWIEDILVSVFVAIFALLIGIIGLIFFVWGAYVSYHSIDYVFNQAHCHLYIDGKQVYNGRQYFVEIQSIGENGNTKEVIIYQDKLKLKPKKVYVSNDVRVM